MSDLRLKIKLPSSAPRAESSLDVGAALADTADEEREDNSEGNSEQGEETDAEPNGANAIESILKGRKRAPEPIPLRPVLKAWPMEEVEKANYESWKMVRDYVASDGRVDDGEEREKSAFVVPKETMNELWFDAVGQYRGQLMRAQKRLDLEKKMKEERDKEIQALRERAHEEEERRKQMEEEARSKEERERNEARERARQERERLAQTIDMDAQQQIMGNGGDDDDDDDDDMGGF